MIHMKKIIFALTIIAMAFVGLSFVCAADADSADSATPILNHEEQPIVQDVRPIAQETQSIAQDEHVAKDVKTDKVSSDDILSWAGERRGPRGMESPIFDDAAVLSISDRPQLGGALGGGSGESVFATLGGGLGGGPSEHYYATLGVCLGGGIGYQTHTGLGGAMGGGEYTPFYTNFGGGIGGGSPFYTSFGGAMGGGGYTPYYSNALM